MVRAADCTGWNGVGAIRRTGWLVLVALVGASVAYLMTTAIRAGSSYYLTVAEAEAAAAAGHARQVRIQGMVDGATLRWDPARLQLRFDLVDEQRPSRRLAVEYTGVRPDGLEGGRTVIVEGQLRQGRLQATAVLVRCPSRYEAEVARLPRRGS